MSLDVDLSLPRSTERMTLRVLDEIDLDAVHGWRSRADVTEYLPYGPQSRQQVATALRTQSRVRRLVANDDRVVLAAVVDEQTVGELHLVLKSATLREFEVGWVFAPEVAGRGYATEGARELLRIAFGEGRAHRVMAELDPLNTASVNLCRRLGMREEAHFVKNFRFDDGSWGDTGIWAILDEEHAGA